MRQTVVLTFIFAYYKLSSLSSLIPEAVPGYPVEYDLAQQYFFCFFVFFPYKYPFQNSDMIWLSIHLSLKKKAWHIKTILFLSG